MYDRIKELSKARGLSINKLEMELKMAKGYLSKIDKVKPSNERLMSIANYFNVSLEYLTTGDEKGKNTSLNQRDEKDIAKRLESTLSDLADSQEALMFSGEPLDEETRELLKVSLENSIRIAKINAKQKYTPKKYRNKNE